MRKANTRNVTISLTTKALEWYRKAAKSEGLKPTAFIAQLVALGWYVYCDSKSGLQGDITHEEDQ